MQALGVSQAHLCSSTAALLSVPPQCHIPPTEWSLQPQRLFVEGQHASVISQGQLTDRNQCSSSLLVESWVPAGWSSAWGSRHTSLCYYSIASHFPQWDTKRDSVCEALPDCPFCREVCLGFFFCLCACDIFKCQRQQSS